MNNVIYLISNYTLYDIVRRCWGDPPSNSSTRVLLREKALKSMKAQSLHPGQGGSNIRL